MKKCISLLIAMVMVFSFASISFAASDINVAIESKEINVGVGTESVTLNFTISLPVEKSLMGVQPVISHPGLTVESYSLTGEGLTWDTSGSNINRTDNTSYLSFDDLDTVGCTAAQTYILTVVFSVPNTEAKEYAVTMTDFVATDSDWCGLTDEYTWGVTPAKINVKAAAVVKTVAKANPVINYNATTMTNGKTTDAQIGAAVALTFTKPAATLQNKMIWAVQTPAGRRYSQPVDVQIADVTGDVAVAATFLNGIHENSFGIAEVAPIEITGVDGIFFDGTEEYYTNEADKANKE